MTTTDQMIVTELKTHLRRIDDRGGSLAGYCLRYGSKDDPDHHGDCGETIYAADIGQLHKLIGIAQRRGLTLA
jgi:hypothetical protein